AWVEATPGFAPLVEALRARRAATIDGAWHSSVALAAATLGLAAPQTLLIVLAHPRDLDAWGEDLASFSGQRAHVFPAWAPLPTGDTVLDEIGGRRLRLLRQLESDMPPRFVLTTMQALLQPVPDREQLSKQRKRLRVGQEVGLEALTAWLVERNFERMEAVEIPGEFSRRGGILDVYSPDAEAPYRIEFMDDVIESIRQFSPESQRSLGDLQAVEITAQYAPFAPLADVAGAFAQTYYEEVAARLAPFVKPSSGRKPRPSPLAPLPGGERGERLRGHLCDYLPTQSWTMLVEAGDLEEQGKHYLERVADIT